MHAHNPPSFTDGIVKDKDAVKSSDWSWRRPLFLFLSVILFVVILLRLISTFFPRTNQSRQVESIPPEETLTQATGTFVDSIYGIILYYSDDRWYELTLPDRSVRQISAAESGKAFESSSRTLAWSTNGKYLALPRDKQTIALTKYASGDLVSLLTLPREKKDSESLYLSFSPFADVIEVAFVSPNVLSDEVYFFDVATGTQMGVYEHCMSRGVWLSGEGYVMRCALADSESVALVRFSDLSARMITIGKLRKPAYYEVLTAYSGSRVLVSKTMGNTTALGTLGVNGVFAPLSVVEKRDMLSIEILRNPEAALIRRIERVTGIKEIDHVSVSSDNGWAAFSAQNALYAVDLKLEHKPFMLTKGELPEIKPY